MSRNLILIASKLFLVLSVGCEGSRPPGATRERNETPSVMKPKLNAPWKNVSQPVLLHRPNATEQLTAKEADYVLTYRGGIEALEPVIALSRPNGQVAWVGPKMDAYVQSADSVIGLKLANGGHSLEWRTNVFRPTRDRQPLGAVVREFDRNVSAKSLTAIADAVGIYPDLPDSFFSKEPHGSQGISTPEISIKGARFNGGNLVITIEGAHGELAIVTLDLSRREVAKVVLDGKQLK